MIKEAQSQIAVLLRLLRIAVIRKESQNCELILRGSQKEPIQALKLDLGLEVNRKGLRIGEQRGPIANRSFTAITANRSDSQRIAKLRIARLNKQ